MPIKVQILPTVIKIRILNGDWDGDLAKCKDIPGRSWNKDTKTWDIARNQYEDIESRWNSDYIFFTDSKSEEYAKQKGAGLAVTWSNPEELPFIANTPVTYYGDGIKPFQLRYIKLNEKLTKIGCSGPVGSGKTLSALERIKLLDSEGVIKAEKILIIAPKRVRTNWKIWIRRVLGKEALIYWAKTKKQRLKLLEKVKDHDVFICSYQTAKEFAEKLEMKYSQVIVDEVHLACHGNTDRFKAVDLTLSQNPECGLQILSGTPMQNKPKDLWGPMHFLDPIGSGAEKTWHNKYERVVNSITKKIPRKGKNGDYQRDSAGEILYRVIEIPLQVVNQNLDHLRDRIRPWWFRVSKEEVFEDLKHEPEPIFLEMSNKQRSMYNTIRDEILVELDDRVINVQQAAVKMLRLLQVCEGIFNIAGDKEGESSKLEYCIDYINELDLQEEDSEKTCIFWSNFQEITFKIQEAFPDKVVVFNGAMSDEENQLAVWAFNGVGDAEEEKDYWELVEVLANRGIEWKFKPGEAQIFAGVMNILSSLGIDLHRRCNKQIVTSMTWMHVVLEQTLARLVRLGQEKGVVYSQFLLIEDTIESKCWKMVLENAKVSSQILDGDGSIDVEFANNLIDIFRKEAAAA